MTDQPISPPTEPVPTWAPTPPARSAGGSGTGGSGTVTAAGVILLVIAALAGLLGILALLGGAIMSQMPTLSGSDSGLTQEELDAVMSMGRTFILVTGGVALAIGLAHLLSGIGVLRRRSWARILGLVMSVLGVLLWALILVGTLVVLMVMMSG